MSYWLLMVGGGSCLSVALSPCALAQPQAPLAPKRSREELSLQRKADWTLYEQAVDQAETAQRAGKSSEALSAYQTLLDKHPELAPDVRATAWRALSNAQDDAGQHGEALSTLDLGLAEVEAQAGRPRSQRTSAFAHLRLVRAKASLLESQQKTSAAYGILQAAWPLLIEGGRTRDPSGKASASQNEAINFLNRFLILAMAESKAQNQSPDDQAKAASQIAARFVSECPTMLDEAVQVAGDRAQPGFIYRQIVDSLSQAKLREEALGWAKLRFLTCGFEAGAIQRSTQQLGQLWAEKGDLAAAKAFDITQKNVDAPNPLQAVPLPPLDKTQVRQDLARLKVSMGRGNLKSLPQNVHESITLLAVLGEKEDLGLAMSLAKQLWIGALDKPEGVREVCRVFKGTDADIARANQFLQFLQGNGPDPMIAFFQEYPEQPVK